MADLYLVKLYYIMKTIIFLTCIWSACSELILAINCGGDEYIDSKGNIWSKDKDFEGGQTNFINDNKYIRFTSDPYIYISERQHSDDFFYSIPMLDQGNYVIVLKNLEYFNIKGKKITNFYIGSQAVHGDMNVFQGIKDLAAIDEYIQISINNSEVFWNGKLIENAVRNKKIILKFSKNASEPARISGILVVRGGLEDTEYFEYIAKVNRFMQLVKNKAEMADKPIQFPKDHQILHSATLYSVMFKYPFAIIFSTIAFYLILSKVINLES